MFKAISIVIVSHMLKLPLVFLVLSLTACATFPIGPKRTFNNWEDAPMNTPTLLAPPTLETPHPQLITPTTALPTLQASPIPTDLSEPTQPTEPIEYAFPDPQPFTLGQTPTEFGIQINGCDKDVPAALAIAKRMGLTWIKQQARWAEIETAPDQFKWGCLDRVIPTAHAQGFKVLISVTTAAAHTRQVYRGALHPTNGRPADFRDFGLFLAYLITRYDKQIAAIEMFNEPNIIDEWGDVIDGSIYAGLLAVGYGVTKFLDPSIMVISAGLAPNGLNDKWSAIGDEVFLKQLTEVRGEKYADCIGAHANGPDGVGEIHVMAPRYFDLATQQRPLCFTELGYGLPSADDHTPKGFDWLIGHTAARQAEVLTESLRWARQSGYVRLVILWNLNFDGPTGDPNSAYALVRGETESTVIAAITNLLN